MFDVLVICGDEHFKYVEEYLKLLFSNNKNYLKKKTISIGDLRKITGDKNIRSFADNIARSYRKRALKSKTRQQRGISLNVVKIN